MNNYQLYRTNILLSGQMKWDLILNSAINKLYVSDFHLTPISDNAPYTYKTDEQLIYNSHQDNVKDFYANNKGIFYKEYLNAEFTHNWPIICKDNEYINTYSNMYDMGCKRSKYFNRYNKQFEFFCPVWIEQLNENDVIQFKIEVKNTSTNTIIGSSTLTLNSIDNTYCEYHNKFVNYINKYIVAAELTDDLININFNTDSATVTGLNVNNGLFETKAINNLVKNITHRERPLMETDNMIIQSLQDNKIICKQLFNFNLCFNFEDIFSKQIVKFLYGENVKISITVFINNTQLELKDFNTEYDFIPRTVYGDETDTQYNVLDYLQDNKYIEFINKNKFCQNICHWSLCDNNDYIFNVYNGFSGIYIDNKKEYENEHCYSNAPNTYIDKYNKILNNTGWINVYNANVWEDFYKFIKQTNKYKTLGTYINPSSNYINNIKYKTVPEIKLKDSDTEYIYIIGLVASNNILPNITAAYDCKELVPNSEIRILFQNNLLMLITNDVNKLTFAKFYSYIKSYNDENEYLKKIKELIISKIDPSIVYLHNSLMYTNADSPNKDSSEIDYMIEDNIYNYVIRYDGKIKPTFTDKTSTLYYKDYIVSNNNTIYNMYAYLNYEPIYPSIGYCAIKKLSDWSREKYPTVALTKNDNTYISGNNFEYKWFNDSKCLVLNQEISFSENKQENDGKTLDTIIENKLRSYYNIENNDNEKIQFIKNMYTYTNNWEYLNNTSITEYVYNISLKLNYNKNI